jgi:hypothetical protein
MSADAKVWHDDTGWHGIDDHCDGRHDGIDYDLVTVLTDIERCMDSRGMRWEFRVYPDGQAGLVGYIS